MACTVALALAPIYRATHPRPVHCLAGTLFYSWDWGWGGCVLCASLELHWLGGRQDRLVAATEEGGEVVVWIVGSAEEVNLYVVTHIHCEGSVCFVLCG